MKFYRVLIILVVVLLAVGIAFLGFSIHFRLKQNEYMFQVDAILAAASVANEEDPLTTDPARSVICEYNGSRWVVVPGNYRTLSSWLRKDATLMVFSAPDREKALKLTVCNEAELYAAPSADSVDVVYLELITMGKSFRIRTDGGNQWTSLLACCTEGTYHDKNIPLD